MDVPITLIKECKKFNKLAQKELFERYSSLFFSICRRYVDSDDDAKDVVQEGFIKIFSKIKQYKGNGSFEGWMKRVMVNTAISMYNKRKSRKLTRINDEKEFLTEPFENSNEEDIEVDKNEITRTEIGYDMVNNANFSYNELSEMLMLVSKPFRDVFNLHCIEGYRHKDVADILKIDEKTSRTRLSRARNQLQDILYKQCIEKIGR